MDEIKKGGWVAELRLGIPLDQFEAVYPSAWAFGQQTAHTLYALMQETNPALTDEVRQESRENHLDLLDGLLDPMGSANLRWAMSDLADDPRNYQAFSLSCGKRMLELLAS